MKTDLPTVLGIDIGSVSVAAVMVTLEKKIVAQGYGIHHGDVPTALETVLSGFPHHRIHWVAASAGTPDTVRATARIDDQVCSIAAARNRFPGAGAILRVGGEAFHLIRLDHAGGYLGSRTSTSCAAGTGAFLDQQARRLCLDGSARLAELAAANTGRRARIATRCAVFAKTDLIHAQQEGHSPEAICDGLCHGLAKNITDAVFGAAPVRSPVVFCGGVALNRTVRDHIAALTGLEIVVPPHPERIGALGAALAFIEEHLTDRNTTPPGMSIAGPADLFRSRPQKPAVTCPPLCLRDAHYPVFDSLESFRYPAETGTAPELTVEVDVYDRPDPDQPVFLGIDIGSTSTKAVLTAPDKTVLCGVYTRTAGRPLDATQRLLRTFDHLGVRYGSRFRVLGAGTTGSGRTFIGRILGADLILDEITAHARAAWELNPAVDTIIEIGGQDAKFTTIEKGRVTSATMNTVCAAGTGSFVEEQAAKLDCPLSEFSRRTENKAAPLSSNRCTVFMERDLNRHLADGWGKDEVLASVLHSVRENYLAKVATESRIGEVVLFQGATAKNRALVAAFEQRLNKPIWVSKYCHLTGALGTALTLTDEQQATTGASLATTFGGIDLWRAEIPVRTEVCELCTNHCKLSVAEVKGKTVACGFLCGRDYGTRHFVPTEKGGFDLMGQRKKAYRHRPRTGANPRPVIGLPAGGHMVEDLPFWREFFDLLGFPTVSSEDCVEALQRGKALAGAEFCVPISALYGHVESLKDRCDHIFLPIYLEERTSDRAIRRQYCYYTQYAPLLAASAGDTHGARLLSPLLRYLYTGFHTRMELYRMFRAIPGAGVRFFDLTAAYEGAERFVRDGRRQLTDAWNRHTASRSGAIRVVFLGRPYTIFSSALNARIPELFRRMGIDGCTQEMLPVDPASVEPIRPLLNQIHWRHAATVIAAAQATTRMPGVYPVLITSFKCTPDAFVRDYVKRIMTAAGKPFLVLELDEHDSHVGYETRIEAAARAFQNHFRNANERPMATARDLNPMLLRGKTRRTIVLPNWDRLSGPLLEAVLRREGYDAVLMTETEATIQKSLRENSGQCIPLNAIVEGFADCLTEHRLAPEKTALWVGDASMACNVALYPHHMKMLLNARGGGLESAGVYVGEILFIDIGLRAAIRAAFAYMFGGLLRRVACRLRPYEVVPGTVDRELDAALPILYDAFLGRMRFGEALKTVTERFGAIAVRPASRPKVAIFGDLYCRDNRVMNQDLIRFIEAHGGEVVTTPYSDYARMIANPYFRKWFNERRFLTLISSRALMASLACLERRYYQYFEPLLNEPMAAFDDPPEAILSQYGVRIEHTGESLDNLLKVHYIKKHHPDVSLFVQASPAFCCPALVTEAMSRQIETVTGVPVVSVTYDGTGGDKNDAIVPYLKYPRKIANEVRRSAHRRA